MDRRKATIRLIRSEAGFTITELMVSIVISGFILAVAATGFSAFFAKFDDINKTIELQRDAFNCLQTIKSGIPIGTGTNLKFSGIATADSVRFGGLGTNAVSSEIYLYPPITSVDHAGDYVRIFHDGRYVRYSYVNGPISTPSPKYLFPQPTRGNKTWVTSLSFSKANVLDVTTNIVSVSLVAKVEVRKNKYKTVTYNTKMAIAMDK